MSVLPDRKGASEATLAVEKLSLRLDAVASSRIEGYYQASFEGVAFAEIGEDDSEDDLLASRNAKALYDAAYKSDLRVSAKAMLEVHQTIMEGEYFAGRFREEGEVVSVGSYVAPLPHLLEGLLGDWVRFASRPEEDFVSHIALAHSQYESIHPFCDGNGRSGRAEMMRMLLGAGKLAVPFSTALFEARQRYYDTFDAYRQGDLEYPIHVHAAALTAAGEAVRQHTLGMDGLLESWRHLTRADRPENSEVSKALGWIAHNPVFSEPALADGAGISSSDVGDVTAALLSACIIRTPPDVDPELKIWVAPGIIELAGDIEKTVQKLASDSVSKIRYKDTEFWLALAEAEERQRAS